MTPPSIPPPPPPPPPLNIPPSRARLQLAARLAMHQKKSQSFQPSSEALYRGGDDEDNTVDPFRDGDDDLDDDDDDDDDVEDDELQVNIGRGSSRGSWWRSMVGKKVNNEGDDSDEADEDEDEFGDFAMAEEDNKTDGGASADSLVLRPLPINPAKESSRGLSGLWPFGSKSDSRAKREHESEGHKIEDMTFAGDKQREGRKAIEVKEAVSRTSIEEPDDDEVMVGVGAAAGKKQDGR